MVVLPLFVSISSFTKGSNYRSFKSLHWQCRSELLMLKWSEAPRLGSELSSMPPFKMEVEEIIKTEPEILER